MTLVTGPTSLAVPQGVTAVAVCSAEQMKDAVLEQYASMDVVIKSAAVADYRPVVRAAQKVKKQAAELTLALEKNPDILSQLGQLKQDQVLVGFAAETEQLLENATDKLNRKNLDLIVANDVDKEGAGFNVDTNIVRFLHATGEIEEFDLMSKLQVAEQLLDRVARLWIARRVSDCAGRSENLEV